MRSEGVAEVEWRAEASRSGAPSLCLAGRRAHSAYDPAAEAERNAERMLDAAHVPATPCASAPATGRERRPGPTPTTSTPRATWTGCVRCSPLGVARSTGWEPACRCAAREAACAGRAPATPVPVGDPRWEVFQPLEPGARRAACERALRELEWGARTLAAPRPAAAQPRW